MDRAICVPYMTSSTFQRSSRSVRNESRSPLPAITTDRAKAVLHTHISIVLRSTLSIVKAILMLGLPSRKLQHSSSTVVVGMIAVERRSVRMCHIIY